MTTDTSTAYRPHPAGRGRRRGRGPRTLVRVLAVVLALLLVGWGAARPSPACWPGRPTTAARRYSGVRTRSTSTWPSSRSRSSVRPTRRRCR